MVAMTEPDLIDLARADAVIGGLIATLTTIQPDLLPSDRFVSAYFARELTHARTLLRVVMQHQGAEL